MHLDLESTAGFGPSTGLGQGQVQWKLKHINVADLNDALQNVSTSR